MSEENSILRKGLRKFTNSHTPMDEGVLGDGNPNAVLDVEMAKSVLDEAKSIRYRAQKDLDWKLANSAIDYVTYAYKSAELKKEFDAVVRQIYDDLTPHAEGGQSSGD